MTRLTPLLTSRKVLDITYQTPQETLLSTPETLPTSEPTTPQIGYTVAEAHLPTFSFKPYRPVWVAMVFGAGKFTTSGTLYWRMKRNGTSVATSSTSVSANTFYTCQAYFYNVSIGDVLELALWSSVSGSNWDYKAYQIQVTRLIPFNKPRLLSPCDFSTVGSQPYLSLGNPHVFGTGLLYPYHDDRALPSTVGATYTSLYPKDTFGLYRIYRGDSINLNYADVLTHLTYRPCYYNHLVPTRIIMRGVRID